MFCLNLSGLNQKPGFWLTEMSGFFHYKIFSVPKAQKSQRSTSLTRSTTSTAASLKVKQVRKSSAALNQRFFWTLEILKPNILILVGQGVNQQTESHQAPVQVAHRDQHHDRRQRHQFENLTKIQFFIHFILFQIIVSLKQKRSFKIWLEIWGLGISDKTYI